MFAMSSYRHSKEDERRIVRCAACDAMVFAEIAGFGRVDANTVCTMCGMTMPDLPVVDGDYFNVVMRVGRPHGRVARFRRPK
jgi:hypothetical protein